MRKIILLLTILLIAVTLTACVDPVEHTVTFNPNGGILNGPAVITVNAGQTVTQPADPIRQNADFDGWFTSRTGGEKWDFETPVTENITLFAQWLVAPPVDNEALAAVVIQLIANLPVVSDLTLAHDTQVQGAVVAYELLPAAAKLLVTNYNLLAPLLARLDELHAEVVIGIINDLPALETVTINDAQAIGDARVAFGRLTADQQTLVTNLDHLIALEEFIRSQRILNPLQIFYFNDLHGALERASGNPADIGIAGLANVIRPENARTDINTITILGGDMMHGFLVSNYFQGASSIDTFNQLGVDAFVIGNHEWNWGLPALLQFWDGTHDIQANFPLLGANVYIEGTNFSQRPQHIDPYTIVVGDDGSKVGIVGLIGMVRNSISAQHVEGFIFRDPFAEATEQVQHLQQNYDLDMIIVTIHDGDRDDQFAAAMNALGVQVVFTAHDHIPQNRLVGNTVSFQATAHGRSLGQIEFAVSNNEFSFTRARQLTASIDQRLASDDPVVAAVLHEYLLAIENLQTRVLATADDNFSVIQLTEYLGYLMATQFGGDAGFHNSGGTRTTISNNQQITFADVLRVFPFDNQILVFQIQGRHINTFRGRSDGSNGWLGLSNFTNNGIYTVVTHDFIFGRNSVLSNNAIDLVTHGILIWELMVEAVTQQGDRGQRFNIANAYIPNPDLYAPISLMMRPELWFDGRWDFLLIQI